MKKGAKADRDNEWRRNQQGGHEGMRKKILAGRAQSSFFGRALGRKYHILGMFFVLSVLIVYYLRQNTTSNISMSKVPSDDRDRKVIYLTPAERQIISAAIKSTGGNSSAVLVMMHQFAGKIVDTGRILFPIKARGGIHFIPHPFCEFPDRRIRGAEDMQHYEEARRWLKERRDILKMTPKMFVSTLKVLNQKITGTPHELHDFRYKTVWLNKNTIGLFDDIEDLKKLLIPQELSTAEEIKAKVNFIATNVAKYDESVEEYHHKESIMVDLNKGEGNVLEQMARDAGAKNQLQRVQERRLTAKEKRLVKKLYDIKEELTSAQQASLLEKDFEDFLKSDGDVITRAGKLHFIILKRHSFNDGNGRDARAMTDEFLHQHDLPPVFYPNHEEYQQTASRSVLADDPQILIDYFRQHIDGQKYLETMELAGSIQDECVDVEGGTDKCNELLLNVVARSGRGFC
jgi:prophage maintenance system killer protein